MILIKDLISYLTFFVMDITFLRVSFCVVLGNTKTFIFKTTETFSFYFSLKFEFKASQISFKIYVLFSHLLGLCTISIFLEEKTFIKIDSFFKT